MEATHHGVPVGLDVAGAAIIGERVFDIRKYGAKCDARVVNDATLAARTGAGNTTIGSATAAFTQADVGKKFGINNSTPTVDYPVVVGTIVSVESGTSATVSVAATVSAIASGGSLCIGTDDSVAIDAAITAASSTGKGGAILVPGPCVSTAAHNIPNNCVLLGTCKPAGDPTKFLSGGSSITLLGYVASGGFITLNKGVTLRDIGIDAAKRAPYAVLVQTLMTRAVVARGCIGRGLTTSYKIEGGSSQTSASELYAGWQGSAVEITGDTSITDNYIFGAGANQPNLKANGIVDDCQIVGNHIYKGGWGITLSTVPGPNMQFTQWSTSDTAGGTITGNSFDTAEGNHIEIIVYNTDATAPLKGLTITGNQFYQPQPFTDNTYSCIDVKVGSTGSNNVSLRGLSVVGNTGKGYAAGSRSYKSFINFNLKSGNGTLIADSVIGNTIDNCNAIYSTTGGSAAHTPAYSAGNCVIPGTGTSVTVG